MRSVSAKRQLGGSATPAGSGRPKRSARRTRLLSVSLVALAVATAGALGAPGIAHADCATVTVSPKIAPVGTVVTAHATLTGSPNCGQPDTYTWNQSGAPKGNAYPYSVFTAVSGCGKGATTCALRVHYDQGATEGGFAPLCLQGPGWSECDAIKIYPAMVSGTVTVNVMGERPKPAADVKVAGGGQTASFNTFTHTNAEGQYTLLLPGGPSIISAGPLYGPYRTADPGAVHWPYKNRYYRGVRPALNTDLLDVNGNISNLDFVTASCVETHTCPLKLYVRVLQTLRSGLGLNRDYPAGGPVNFTVPFSSNAASPYSEPGVPTQRCRSGCVNVLVGVIDPQTHRDLAGASVDASVGTLAGFDGTGFLCVQLATGELDCGTSLSGLETDKYGKLHLFYWAPGAITPASTELTVTATSPTCTDASCAAPITQTTDLSITPYPIYTVAAAELGPYEVQLLIEMARDAGVGELLREAFLHKAIEGVLSASIAKAKDWFVAGAAQAIIDAGRQGEYAAELLKQVGELAEAASAKAEMLGSRALLLITAALKSGEAYSAYQEQAELVVLFLSAFRLSTLGLDVESYPYQAEIPDLSPAFESLILSRSWIPTKLAAAGVMWSLAQSLAAQYGEEATTFKPARLALHVYEVSYCDKIALEERTDACGPGYYLSLGIRPMLDFVFSAPGWEDSFSVPYDPRWWIPGQKGLSPSPA